MELVIPANFTDTGKQSIVHVPDDKLQGKVLVSMSNGKHMWGRQLVSDAKGQPLRYEYQYIPQEAVLHLA